MIEVEETPDGLRAIDLAKNEVEIELGEWAPGGEGFEIDRRVHATVSGAANEIRFPLSGVLIEDKRGSSWRLAVTDERESIERGEYLIQAESSMAVFVRTNSGFELRQDHDEGETTILFPTRTELTFGFRSYEKRPDDEIRIPPTPEGMASALTVMGEYHETETPDRSYPSMRLHPPLIEVDDTAHPVEPNADSTPTIRIELPRSLEDLFVVAPLAYYLGAEVAVVEGRRPSVITETEQFDVPAGTPLPEWTKSLLKRAFYLDCLVRNAGPYGVELAEMTLLDDLSLDIDDVYDLLIGQRLVEYLAVDFERVADGFPKWPLSMFVEPEASNISTIPHLLNKLALIHPPESEVMGREELISRSLEDFQRSRGVSHTDAATDQPVLHRPKRRHSARQGWVADGAVADGFKCTPQSLSSGLTRFGDSQEVSIVVVLNERDMDAELYEAVQTYRKRGENFPISVEVNSNLTKRELRDVFETPTDFVHYIGHCDDEGLRCADGHFNVKSLTTSRVKMFFLNACGSYQQGLGLVRKGSVAGTVTANDVIDSQARKVGGSLAKLLTLGFSLDRAVSLARRWSIMNHQYIILGDGTQSLNQGFSTVSLIVSVEELSDGSFSIHYIQDCLGFQGGFFKGRASSRPVLSGNPDRTVVTDVTLKEILEQNQEPVIYKDSLYWPDELLEELF